MNGWTGNRKTVTACRPTQLRLYLPNLAQRRVNERIILEEWPANVKATPQTTASSARTDPSSGFAAMPKHRLDPGLAVVLVVAYLGLEWLSFLHEHDGLPVTPWNPGLGLMFAIIIMKGAVYGGVLLVSVILSQVLVLGSELSWAATGMVAAIVSGAYTAVAALARGLLRFSTRHFLTRDMLVLISTGLAGAVLASTALCLLMLWVAPVSRGDLIATAGLLILGDLIGIAVVSPLVLRGYVQRHSLLAIPRRIMLELGSCVTVILIALAFITRPDRPDGHEQFYLLFVPVVLAAVRHGIDGACAALAVAQLGLVGFLHVYGFDLARFTEYQLLMLVLTMTVLLVGAVVSERDAADTAATDAASRLQDLQGEVARSARLNLVSGMATALAHEINQPLTAARALARSVDQLLKSEPADKARASRNVASMIEQIDHAANVIRGMRDFLRRGEPHVSTADAETIVNDALALVRPLATSRSIELVITAKGEIPPTFADRVQIQQVVINLVRNSIDAIGEAHGIAGKVEIELRQSEPGREIEISIRDNGSGIAPDRLQTIFDPMTTTKADGLGLGLSICKTIVEAHGGRMWVVQSSPEGTEFRFSLPIARSNAGGT